MRRQEALTFLPAWRRARASSVEMVLFPTPPFPERTRTMCRTPARFPGSGWKDRREKGWVSPPCQPPSAAHSPRPPRTSYTQVLTQANAATREGFQQTPDPTHCVLRDGRPRSVWSRAAAARNAANPPLCSVHM